MIVEVADSSLRYDLGEKAMLYSQAGISDYWVVDIGGQVVHQHRNPTVDGYQEITVLDQSSKLSPLCKPEAELSLAELFSDE